MQIHFWTVAAFALFWLFAGVACALAAMHRWRKAPSAYYQVAIGSKLMPWVLASRTRAADRGKELAKAIPGTTVEIWGYERVGYAKVSVNDPHHWGVDQTVKEHWPTIDITDAQRGDKQHAVDSIPMPRRRSGVDHLHLSASH